MQKHRKCLIKKHNKKKMVQSMNITIETAEKDMTLIQQHIIHSLENPTKKFRKSKYKTRDIFYSTVVASPGDDPGDSDDSDNTDRNSTNSKISNN